MVHKEKTGKDKRCFPWRDNTKKMCLWTILHYEAVQCYSFLNVIIHRSSVKESNPIQSKNKYFASILVILNLIRQCHEFF
jgi:hypothetical protein